MNKKRLIIISLGLLGLTIIVAGVYLLISWLNKKPEIIIKQSQKPELIKTINQKIFFPVLTTDNQGVLFFSNKQESAFYKFSFDKKKTEKISENLDASPDNIIWSPDRIQGILMVTYDKYVFEKYGSLFTSPETENGTETKWLYDFSQKKLVNQLNSQIQKIIWSPDSQKIFYYYHDETTDTLAVANPDGSNWQKLTDLSPGWYDFAGWVDKENLVYFRQPTDVSGAEIYSINIVNKQIKKLADGTSKNALVSLNGQWLAYELFHQDQENYTLAVVKSDGSNAKDLGIVGSIDKIVWLPDGQSLITTIKENNKTTDIFYKIDVESGQKQVIKYYHGSPVEAEELVVSKDGQSLYFKNTFDGHLYQLNLR